jgi:hypothetical protein
MRRLRKSRLARVSAGALTLAIPGSAVAFAAGQADAQSAIQMNLSSRHIALGQNVTVTGSGPAASGGQTVTLEFRRNASGSWRAISSTKLAGNGHFKFVVALRRSGLLKVAPASSARSANATIGSTAGATTPSASSAKPVSVGSQLRVSNRSYNLLEGQSVTVHGTLFPAVAGRRVILMRRRGSGWERLATARTGGRGGFTLRYTPGSTGRQWLWVRFDGDRLNTRTWAHSGQLTIYRQAVASWYDDGGSTACGFHAYYGVANRDLACGTHVTFRYGGHSVTAVVDDRGPYVGGRDWDLNQNTASALGFDGVDTVWSTI